MFGGSEIDHLQANGTHRRDILIELCPAITRIAEGDVVAGRVMGRS